MRLHRTRIADRAIGGLTLKYLLLVAPHFVPIPSDPIVSASVAGVAGEAFNRLVVYQRALEEDAWGAHANKANRHYS